VVFIDIPVVPAGLKILLFVTISLFIDIPVVLTWKTKFLRLLSGENGSARHLCSYRDAQSIINSMIVNASAQ
jgi:hypothetical protein